LPNIKSSERSIKTDALRRARNFSVKSAIKTASRKINDSTPAAETPTLLSKAASVIDKAAKRNILHKNTAARKKSRLARRANALAAKKA
jgi:small subunit ribosomal protein S20